MGIESHYFQKGGKISNLADPSESSISWGRGGGEVPISLILVKVRSTVVGNWDGGGGVECKPSCMSEIEIQVRIFLARKSFR